MTEHENEAQPSALDRTHWMDSAVSWGQLLIALVALIGSSVAMLVAYERRLVTVEERQQGVLRAIADLRADEAVERATITRKLDTLVAQMTMLTIDIARHQALSEVQEVRARREHNGVQLPK